RDAALRRIVLYQIANGLERDVGGQREKAHSNNAERKPLVVLAAMNVLVDLHPPKQSSARDHLNEAVDAETNQRDASCHCAGDYSHDAFEAVPREREVFQPAASAYDGHAITEDSVRHP